MAFTTWNFLKDKRITGRIKDARECGFDEGDLEEGDHILRWSRGNESLRYVHAFEDGETRDLVESSGLKEVATFMADGKSGDLNSYIVLRKVQ